MIRHPQPANAAAPGQRGAALVVGLILLLVLTLLAISGMTTASLELLMAGNEQYRERAFQAADAGVEQALAAGVYNTNTPIGTYDNVAAINPVPDRGTGQAIANCAEVASPTDAQQCEYFMRFDLQSGQTPVPGRRLQHRHGIRGLPLRRRQLRHVRSRRAVRASAEFLYRRTGRLLSPTVSQGSSKWPGNRSQQPSPSSH